MEIATLGGGCFWCTEAIFQRLKGVESVMSGFAGENPKKINEHPTYEEVSSGKTGHAEAIQITFNPKIISFEKLLQIFFATHDPTTMNQQGADIGTQYRSVVFYHTDLQKQIAEQMISELDASGKYKDKIVTEIAPFEKFYKAEDYHQNYYNENKMKNPYCTIVIDPKVRKLIEQFQKDVKDEYRS